MSPIGKRELRSRAAVSTNSVSVAVTPEIVTRRRQSTRIKVSKPNYHVDMESSPSPSPMKSTRKIQCSGAQKKPQSFNGEHKRRKIEEDESEIKESAPGSSSQSISDLETEPSPSSSSSKSPSTKRTPPSIMKLRNTRSQDLSKKLVRNAVGAARASNKRLSDSNPGPSSSIRKLESSPKTHKSKKGPVKGKIVNDKAPENVNSSPTEKLHANVIEYPQCPLPCREVQFEQILSFVQNNIKEKTSGCLYVSGVPGSGKTAIVQCVIETLEKVFKKVSSAETVIFKNVYINGLSLGSPDRIWKRFYHGLHHDKIKLTSATALKKLGSYFETKSHVPVVLVIDELDQLLDKQQSILYTLLEWASHPSTMFSLVAIFNTMNLPETVFASRNSSRMGFSRVIFPPYNHEQLQTIVSNFLADQSSTKLNSNAISLLSRKVAALSGDARRALEISKRALEIVEEGNDTGAKAVNEAFKEIFSSPKIDTVKDCSMLEQLFLKTVSTEQQRTGIEETTLMTVQSNIVTLAPFEGLQWSPDQFLTAASKLVSMKLIVAENDSSSLHKKISLNIPVEDINYALDINSNATTNGHHD